MSRLFPIQDDQGYYSTGVLPNGNQVLCGVGGPNFVKVEFSGSGDYLDIKETPTDPHLLRAVGERFLAVNQTELNQEFEDWKNAMELIPSTIQVKLFSIENYRIALQEFPEFMQEEAERGDEDAIEWMQEWKASGSFVLYWGNDYFLSPDGEVESS
jgi:hypothetical protein